jgi:hypothetical protein
MNALALRFAVALMLAIIAGVAVAQRQDRAPFQFRDGYEEARFGSGDVTIKTRDGAKALHVSLSKLRLARTDKPATVRLPGSGLALLQHVAARAKVVIGRESFEPLEGEWMRLPLPTAFSLSTDKDTIQIDLILIEEKVSQK